MVFVPLGTTSDDEDDEKDENRTHEITVSCCPCVKKMFFLATASFFVEF